MNCIDVLLCMHMVLILEKHGSLKFFNTLIETVSKNIDIKIF
jgi:hypothetical protein